MSKKKATPSAVFAACEALDQSGNPWNRDDVRLAVGGGGYSVIDPLIQAWRKIKPIKAVAPQTPTELIHLIAKSIDNHLTDFMHSIETRDCERAKAFESATNQLCETLSTQEDQIRSMQYQLQTAHEQIEALEQKHQALIEQLNHQKHINQKLEAENDALNGTKLRLENQLKEDKQLHLDNDRQQKDAFEAKLQQVTSEYKEQLQQQKRDILKSNELSENRLMRIIAQERSDTKLQIKELQTSLEHSKQSEQDQKEANTRLSIENQHLAEQVTALNESLHQGQDAQIKELKSALKALTHRLEECE